MAPTVYLHEISPPARTVLMVAKAIGVPINVKELDLIKGDHLKPEFLKINPQHTIPTFVDEDGFVICDSHAMTTYLVSKYAKNDVLYPKDLKKRTLVDEKLHFDSAVAFGRLKPLSFNFCLKGRKTPLNETEKQGILEVYDFMEAFLKDKDWMAGDSVSVADYSLLTSLGGLKILIPVDANKYPKLEAWRKRMEQLPEYEVNQKGQKLYEDLLGSKLNP